MSSFRDLVLAESNNLLDDGDLSVAVVASVDNNTVFMDGVPIDGYATWLRIRSCDNPGNQEGQQRFLLREEKLFELANALAAAGYKLREARLKAKRQES